jgi:hypothetical protein
LLLQVQAVWGCSHAVLCSLPFSSSFNAGAGLAWFEAGRPMAARPPVTAAAAAGSSGQGTGLAESSNSSSSNGWFNMLLTDTLASCRDPVSQQVRMLLHLLLLLQQMSYVKRQSSLTHLMQCTCFCFIDNPVYNRSSSVAPAPVCPAKPVRAC